MNSVSFSSTQILNCLNLKDCKCKLLTNDSVWSDTGIFEWFRHVSKAQSEFHGSVSVFKHLPPLQTHSASIRVSKLITTVGKKLERATNSTLIPYLYMSEDVTGRMSVLDPEANIFTIRSNACVVNALNSLFFRNLAKYESNLQQTHHRRLQGLTCFLSYRF